MPMLQHRRIARIQMCDWRCLFIESIRLLRLQRIAIFHIEEQPECVNPRCTVIDQGCDDTRIVRALSIVHGHCRQPCRVALHWIGAPGFRKIVVKREPE